MQGKRPVLVVLGGGLFRMSEVPLCCAPPRRMPTHLRAHASSLAPHRGGQYAQLYYSFSLPRARSLSRALFRNLTSVLPSALR